MLTLEEKGIWHFNIFAMNDKNNSIGGPEYGATWNLKL